MLTIGLTGGIASGKTLVARIFRDLGAHLIDADRIVHELLEPGQPAWSEVLDHFGRNLRLPNANLDRRKLGEIVFRDSQEREWLNRCLHPRVFDVYNIRLRHIREREQDAIVVFDAALLIETGYYKKMDKLVVVYVDEEQQLNRLMERDGYSRTEAAARIRSQMPLSEKKAYADYVIDNRSSREETEHQVRNIFSECRRESERTA